MSFQDLIANYGGEEHFGGDASVIVEKKSEEEGLGLVNYDYHEEVCYFFFAFYFLLASVLLPVQSSWRLAIMVSIRWLSNAILYYVISFYMN
jgi:hypothetical protein